jgi:hypothetical protein
MTKASLADRLALWKTTIDWLVADECACRVASRCYFQLPRTFM